MSHGGLCPWPMFYALVTMLLKSILQGLSLKSNDISIFIVYLISGSIVKQDLSSSGSQLFDYIIQHQKIHGLKVVAMAPTVEPEVDSVRTLRKTYSHIFCQLYIKIETILSLNLEALLFLYIFNTCTNRTVVFYVLELKYLGAHLPVCMSFPYCPTVKNWSIFKSSDSCVLNKLGP